MKLTLRAGMNNFQSRKISLLLLAGINPRFPSYPAHSLLILPTTPSRLCDSNDEYIKYLGQYLLKTFTTKRVSAGRVAALIGSPGSTGLSSSNKTPLSAHSGVCSITGTTNTIQNNMEANRYICQ